MFHTLAEVNELQVFRIAWEVVRIIHLAAYKGHMGANDPTAEQKCSVPAGGVVREVLVALHTTTPASTVMHIHWERIVSQLKSRLLFIWSRTLHTAALERWWTVHNVLSRKAQRRHECTTNMRT